MTRVLIIDDETDVLRNVGEMLEMEGYEVSIANDGASGIQQADSTLPDLVICDIGMPQVDGFAVVEALRSHTYTRETPIIMITGYRDQSIINRILDVGANTWVSKPFTREAILDAIASVV